MQTNQLHDIHAHEDGVFNATSGLLIDINNPKAEHLRIDDIINSLSNICRFGGHVIKFYSVAQHSCLVASLAPSEIKREALLHDAIEAYLGDIIKPLKNRIGGEYKSLEMNFMVELCCKYNLRPEVLLMGVKEYDKKALELEHKCLQAKNYGPLLAAMNDHGMCTDPFIWDSLLAKFNFNKMYSTLFDIDLELLQWS